MACPRAWTEPRRHQTLNELEGEGDIFLSISYFGRTAPRLLYSLLSPCKGGGLSCVDGGREARGGAGMGLCL